MQHYFVYFSKDWVSSEFDAPIIVMLPCKDEKQVQEKAKEHYVKNGIRDYYYGHWIIGTNGVVTQKKLSEDIIKSWATDTRIWVVFVCTDGGDSWTWFSDLQSAQERADQEKKLNKPGTIVATTSFVIKLYDTDDKELVVSLHVKNKFSNLFDISEKYEVPITWALLETVKHELREQYRIKWLVEYSWILNDGKLTVLCDELWDDLIKEVMQKHGIKYNVCFV